MIALAPLLRAALDRRRSLIAALAAEGTDCYRLFHGAVEGRPGLTVDAYGPLLIVQTFRDPLAAGELEVIALLAEGREVVWNHRGAPRAEWGAWHAPGPGAEAPREGRELGLRFEVRGRWRGKDPLLFLDLRAGRRWVKANAAGASVLNLFAYTCGLGVAAAAGGAAEVWNVDFAESALAVGRRNAAMNGLDGDHFQAIRADVLPTLRQLAGLAVKGRGARRRYRRFAARAFDLVLLDPPTWAKSPFGAIDLVRDYPSLFKPAALATRPGGRVLATNHVSAVDLEGWLEVLRRAAAKAGRPAGAIEVIAPEADFPSPDGRPPLKIAAVEIL